ncbi:hypothetical protein C962_03198, partial [Brucella melitensis CNGB 1076]
EGVGHVIADAAYDADHLRAFIASDLKATAQIQGQSNTFQCPNNRLEAVQGTPLD